MLRTDNDYNEIIFNIDNMEQVSETFFAKLNGLEELPLHKDCKLGVYKEKTYISWKRLQNLNRWWYGENRTNLIFFLKAVFAEYYLFNEMIVEAMDIETEPERKKRIDKLNTDNKQKVNAWLIGITCIREQYPDLKEVKELVDEVNYNLSPSSPRHNYNFS